MTGACRQTSASSNKQGKMEEKKEKKAKHPLRFSRYHYICIGLAVCTILGVEYLIPVAWADEVMMRALVSKLAVVVPVINRLTDMEVGSRNYWQMLFAIFWLTAPIYFVLGVIDSFRVNKPGIIRLAKGRVGTVLLLLLALGIVATFLFYLGSYRGSGPRSTWIEMMSGSPIHRALCWVFPAYMVFLSGLTAGAAAIQFSTPLVEHQEAKLESHEGDSSKSKQLTGWQIIVLGEYWNFIIGAGVFVLLLITTGNQRNRPLVKIDLIHPGVSQQKAERALSFLECRSSETKYLEYEPQIVWAEKTLALTSIPGIPEDKLPEKKHWARAKRLAAHRLNGVLSVRKQLFTQTVDTICEGDAPESQHDDSYRYVHLPTYVQLHLKNGVVKATILRIDVDDAKEYKEVIKRLALKYKLLDGSFSESRQDLKLKQIDRKAKDGVRVGQGYYVGFGQVEHGKSTMHVVMQDAEYKGVIGSIPGAKMMNPVGIEAFRMLRKGLYLNSER